MVVRDEGGLSSRGLENDASVREGRDGPNSFSSSLLFPLTPAPSASETTSAARSRRMIQCACCATAAAKAGSIPCLAWHHSESCVWREGEMAGGGRAEGGRRGMD